MDFQRVILVNENDVDIGESEKIRAHLNGDMHRAFSVLIFNSRDEVLLQRRAEEKYHSGGLWSNSCCGHPEPGEELGAAARKRLQEEMGFECWLSEGFKFSYSAFLENGLTENEIDTVFFGRYDGAIEPNASEVSEFRWISVNDLLEEIESESDNFTEWFKIIVRDYIGDVRKFL